MSTDDAAKVRKLIRETRKMLRAERRKPLRGPVAPARVWLVEKWLGIGPDGKPVWRAWSHTSHSRDEARLLIETMRRDGQHWQMRPACYVPRKGKS